MADVADSTRSSLPSAGTGAESVGRIALAAAARHHGAALTRPGVPATSYEELSRAATEIAGGLAALGIAGGDRVAILAGTRPEWTLADFGALCAGAAVVPIYQTNSPEECLYVLAHSEAVLVFCENAAQLAKVEQVRDRCPALKHVVLFEGQADGALPLAALRDRGRAAGAQVAEQRLAAVAPDDPATLVYTSGTTGPPKGCVLTHANLLASVAMYEQRLDLRGAVVYLYLPLAHALARVTQLVTLDVGATLAFWGGDPKRIVAELAEVAPTHFPTVPRVLEKVHSGVLATVEQHGRLRRAVFQWGLEEGRRAAERRRAGLAAGRRGVARERVADRLVLSKVREVFGGRLHAGLTGAAPHGAELLEFFDACGVMVLEGYGMTETCAAATLNTERELRLGTVGRPLPGTEVATAEDGELLMRGPNVFAGYHRDPDATRAVLDGGGWLHSGDLGAIDADGFVYITGRKKEIIITSSGKSISPENLESALRETRFISNAVVYGDRRPYLVALIALDADELPALAAEVGIAPDPAAMAADERVRAVIARDVDAVNRRFARIEQIKRFGILERDLSQAEGELTPTLKVKRAEVYGRYADRLERLYTA
jgi:long-chain acyl-CoA synthetase